MFHALTEQLLSTWAVPGMAHLELTPEVVANTLRCPLTQALNTLNDLVRQGRVYTTQKDRERLGWNNPVLTLVYVLTNPDGTPSQPRSNHAG